MPELPSGTVTFLFTDVEGSTRLLQELGDGYAELLEAHQAVVRAALAAHDGAEVDTQGDAFFAAFASARDAVAAAEEIQRGLAASPTQVRIGLHTGEAELRGGRYVGIDVHRAARVAGAAHGGQVLMSQSTRDLVDAETRDLGEHRLKDLLAPQRLYQLLAPGLQDEFPPPQTLERWRTNLPVQATPLVGRERELAEARALLGRAGGRLLTLTGPGGTGKTRLALQLAAEVLDTFDGGVFFVDLSALREPDLVLPAIAQAAGLRDAPGTPVATRLEDFLGANRALLVLDSVEQVVDSAPDVGRLLAVCPGLEVVATSRAALRLTGEQEYPVPTLDEDEAVELFVERARAVRPGFELDGDRSAVAAICARLDGLPLAVELAAARVKLLPPPKLLERLDDRLTILTGGARDAPERHQTLRATIDWSHDLLDDDERALFARLAVFAGSFTLEGAEIVCDASFDGIASLVEKSLLAEREANDGDVRFALLETVREYAHERLDERGEIDEIRRRHADYVLATVVRVGARDAPNEGLAIEVVRDFENVRAAHAWLDGAGECEGALRLATESFWSVWKITGIRETYDWTVRALERADAVDPAVRADGHGAAALAAVFLGDDEASRRHAEASLALARELGDPRRIEWGLRALSFTETDLGERRRLLGECEAILQETGGISALAWVKTQLAQVCELERDWDGANELFEVAAETFEQHGFYWEATNARLGSARVLAAAGHFAAASAVAEEGLQASAALGALGSVAEALVVLAEVRGATNAAVGLRIVVAARVLYEREGIVPDAISVEALARAERRAVDELGDAFEAEVAAGRELSVDEVVALALSSG